VHPERHERLNELFGDARRLGKTHLHESSSSRMIAEYFASMIN